MPPVPHARSAAVEDSPGVAPRGGAWDPARCAVHTSRFTTTRWPRKISPPTRTTRSPRVPVHRAPGAVRITRTGGGPAPTGRRMAADPVRTGEVRGKRGTMNPIEHLRPSRLPAGPLLSAVVLGAGTHVLVSLGDTGACRRAHGRLARVPSAAPRVRRPLWRQGAVEISRRSGTTGSTRTGRRRRHPPPPAPPQRRASRAHTASKTLR